MLPSGRLAIQALSAELTLLAHVASIVAGTVFAPPTGAGGAAVGGAAVGGAAVGGAAVGGGGVAGGAAVGGAAVGGAAVGGAAVGGAAVGLGLGVGCAVGVTVAMGVALAAAVTSKTALARVRSVARVGSELAVAVCVAACVERRVVPGTSWTPEVCFPTGLCGTLNETRKPPRGLDDAVGMPALAPSQVSWIRLLDEKPLPVTVTLVPGAPLVGDNVNVGPEAVMDAKGTT